MKSLFLIAFLFIGGATFAQDSTSPVWPGCEDAENPKSCFNQQLMKHVQSNYEYPKNDDGDYVRGKVTIKLVINEEGKAVAESIEGSEPEVNKAAEAMIAKIPQLEPGTRKGEPKETSYTIPLTL